MALEHYIAQLLFRYNCVVVPGFGAFLTQMRSAVIDEASNSFYPPTKILSFNGLLTSNDGLLVSYMAEAEGISYDKMLQKLEVIAKEWLHLLYEGGRIKLENIGELQLNGNRKIVFRPAQNINYLTAAFGLSSFVSIPIVREVLKKEVVRLEERTPFIITPETREKSASSSRSYLKYAAILLLALSTGLTAFRFYDETKSTQQLARQEAEQKVTKQIQEATFFDASPVELPTITLDVITKRKNVPTHYIIAGAFRFKRNADRKIRQLQQLGYDSQYLGTNKFGLHMVTYSSYTDAQQALKALHEVKRTRSMDAWLLSKK
jgi:hypothetical protein